MSTQRVLPDTPPPGRLYLPSPPTWTPRGNSESWTGTDCLAGPETKLTCHSVLDSTLTLRYGTSPERVVEGETTVFSSSDHAPSTTFSLWDASGKRCLGAWGADARHYEGICKFWP